MLFLQRYEITSRWCICVSTAYYKGVTKGWSCIVPIWGFKGCVSDLHNALAPILILFNIAQLCPTIKRSHKTQHWYKIHQLISVCVKTLHISPPWANYKTPTLSVLENFGCVITELYCKCMPEICRTYHSSQQKTYLQRKQQYFGLIQASHRPSEKISILMTSSNGSIFRVTSSLCGEFTGHRWILHTKASDGEFWCFLWSAPE